MSARRVRALSFLLISGLATYASTALAQASDVPWTAPVRGSWVRTGVAGSGDVTLASAGNGAEIVVGSNEIAAVHQAAEFLAGDIEKISGYKPAIVAAPSGGHVAIRMVTLGLGQVPASLGTGAMQGQWESYRVITQGNDVWLVGSNARGTAFAAYTLSERLGIDPLYLWTGYTPEHRDPLVLKSTHFEQAPPAFRYRGLFHDDEDILPRPMDDQGHPLQTGDVPLDWYKRYFETALRLRMNMVAPYTRVHRRMEVQQLASDWGLFYTSHHYDILLSNPFGFTRFNLAQERGVKPEYDWFDNKDGLLTYWKDGVLENKDLDPIWPVGMRSTEDRGYTFPPGFTEEQKAATFHEVIADQVNMVKELIPKDKQPIFHFTMYTEMLPLYEKDPKAFDLPKEVIIVWPDDNDGHMRGLPQSLGNWKHGVYYHLAYLGGNLSKQTTHMIPPARLDTEFRKIVAAGATEFMLVNTSETREYVMGARMLADITWNAPQIFAQPNAANRFVAWWSREYFGAGAAAQAKQAYDQYNTLLTIPDQLWAPSNAFQSTLNRLYDRVAGKSFAPLDADTLAQLRSRLTSLDAALATAENAKQQMNAEQAQYFTENEELGLQVAERTTAAALKLDDALRAANDADMWKGVDAARGPLEQLELEFLWDEHPPFDHWYRETWIRSEFSPNNPHRAYDELRAFISSQGRDRLTVPVGIQPPRFGPGGPGRGRGGPPGTVPAGTGRGRGGGGGSN